MRVYRVELMVLDFDGIGEKEITDVIENVRYPNHCISPQVTWIDSRDVGEWSDEHPLNQSVTFVDEFRRLFA